MVGVSQQIVYLFINAFTYNYCNWVIIRWNIFLFFFINMHLSITSVHFKFGSIFNLYIK